MLSTQATRRRSAAALSPVDGSRSGVASATVDLSKAIRTGTLELTLMVGAGILCWLGLALLVLLTVEGAAG
ncbi:MAG: hypothetical protein AB7I59_04040 [Geminicoccaceae bacterium]